MHTIVVIGAGRIGSAIAAMLAVTGDYRVTLADRDQARLDRARMRSDVQVRPVDVSDRTALTAALESAYAVINAAPYDLTIQIAEAAAASGTHYLDLTEDVQSTRHVRDMAREARTAFIPQCGLAPGVVTIIAKAMTNGFEALESVNLRVGALPQFPSNSLRYNLTWSPAGVINEYCEPCEAIVDGELRAVAPLQDLETFVLDGTPYEAFNTSGGLGALSETLLGRVDNLSYRSIRYPGHAELMRFLLRELRFETRRELLLQVFEEAIPATDQDVVIIFVSVTGLKDGRYCQENYANAIYAAAEGPFGPQSAIQRTTASGACTILDLLVAGSLPDRGYVRQEDVPLDTFLANRFGMTFATQGQR